MIVALGYMGIILGLSLIPDKGSSGHLFALVSPNVQNLLHIPAFGLMTGLWIWVFGCYGVFGGRRILIASFLAFLYGSLIEIFQIWGIALALGVLKQLTGSGAQFCKIKGF